MAEPVGIESSSRNLPVLFSEPEKGEREPRGFMACRQPPTPHQPALTCHPLLREVRTCHGHCVTRSLNLGLSELAALLCYLFLTLFVLDFLGSGTDGDRQAQHGQHLRHVQGWPKQRDPGLLAGQEVEQWFQVFSSGPLVCLFSLLLFKILWLR